MIYLFRIITDENPDFFRDVVADSSDTFLELHNSLQENLGYDASQLASFFLTNEDWEKNQEITLIDMMEEPGLSPTTMEGATLEEYISGINQRMIYVFDFFNERAFFIELIETEDQASTRETPFIANSSGDPPRQLALDLLLDDLDMDLEDGDSFDEQDDLRLDDLDPDMFNTGMPED
jgi:hypothetical protein